MSDCKHIWEMENIRFGFVAFEKCFHCEDIRTYFSEKDVLPLGDEYREGPHFWSRIETAQSFRFDLQCAKCKHVEKFNDLMGFMHCTGCLPDCEIDIQRRRLEVEKTWLVVAFGFLPRARHEPMSQHKLDILTDYFNQRRDTSRSRIEVVSFNLIEDLSRCAGDFIHDVGMLSQEPPGVRKPLF